MLLLYPSNHIKDQLIGFKSFDSGSHGLVDIQVSKSINFCRMVALVTIFSEFMKNFAVPVPSVSRGPGKVGYTDKISVTKPELDAILGSDTDSEQGYL